jgi:subtilisin family serine protease
MQQARRLFLPLALAATIASAAVPAEDPTAWPSKVHPHVVAQADSTGEAEFLIFLDEQADLSPVGGLTTKDERGRRVFETLTRVAARSQAPLIAWLEQRQVPHRSFWIANMIWARADLDVIADLAARADVRRIDANPRVRVHEPSLADGRGTTAPGAIEWGLLKVNADDVWALGYDGTGVVVAGQDTGYEWSHPALIDHYRGWNGSSADHDYNWHDAIHSGGGSCGPDSPEPCDDHNHGTHTIGTIVGDDGGANRIGMAPGAEWMACRNMNEGVGTPASYTECFQFFAAPTDVAGNNPDPAKAPHVINNSWTCPPDEGCSHDTLKTIVQNTRAFGIVVVASAGNTGSGCSSIDVPIAIYDAAFTIGATDSADTIAPFSSRGPVTVDGSDRLKPDVSAPGVSVRSSVRGAGYASFSGTSMAGPHVAGLVALLLDARPDLIGRVSDVEGILRLSATPRTTSQECGGVSGSDVPNPVYGYGRIDALEAITGDADGDGVDNLNDCSPVDGDVWTAPGSVVDLRLHKSDPGTALSWSIPPGFGAGAVRYDVLRASEPDGFASPTCLVSDTLQTGTHDTDDAGPIAFYVVRTENSCGANSGQASDGTPRATGACPQSEFPLAHFRAMQESPGCQPARPVGAARPG